MIPSYLLCLIDQLVDAVKASACFQWLLGRAGCVAGLGSYSMVQVQSAESEGLLEALDLMKQMVEYGVGPKTRKTGEFVG